MKYFAKIKYLGTHFHGFQVQPGLRTVQGELCIALREALGVEATVTGCSRTDAGVHANAFCILINAPGATVPPKKLPLAIARYLPGDLSLYNASHINDDFHPRYDAKAKEYVYKIRNSPIYDPFELGRVFFYPRKIDTDGFNNMLAAAEHFIGKHDFSSFMSEGSDIVDPVREIKYLKIVRRNASLFEVRICADGFLYNMVRIIVGTLLEVSSGRIDPKSIPDIIASKKRSNAGMTAPPDGLYLNKVFY